MIDTSSFILDSLFWIESAGYPKANTVSCGLIESLSPSTNDCLPEIFLESFNAAKSSSSLCAFASTVASTFVSLFANTYNFKWVSFVFRLFSPIVSTIVSRSVTPSESVVSKSNTCLLVTTYSSLTIKQVPALK